MVSATTHDAHLIPHATKLGVVSKIVYVRQH